MTDLYFLFGICRHVLGLDVEKSGKKLKIEHVLRAVCCMTFQLMAVMDDFSQLYRHFSDLLNMTRDPTFQQLGIKPDIITMLEKILEMLSETSDSLEDSSDDIPSIETGMIDRAHLPPDEITDWNIVPNKDDVLHAGEVFLRPNKTRTPYPDLETYLDIHFRLLMEDFMYPLREAMIPILQKQKKTDGLPSGVRIYENVRFGKSGLVKNDRLVPQRPSSWRFYNVNFQPLPRVDWKVSRRLIYGSLVFLWDGAEELIVATVANRFVTNHVLSLKSFSVR